RSVTKMNEEITQSRHLGATAGALAIALVFYPMTIAGIGDASNGGVLGFGSLVIASGLSWWAFALNTSSPWVRRLIQLPITTLVTFMAIHDAYCQCVAGWWWGF
ncbi:MAG: hypothetical protein KAH23_10745, partial [Kiritimatiellae bacterium]|nr:hypothetical protein [Kiritimatiellia bacterium]